VTREELHVFLDGWFCGCGSPEAACAELLALLQAHPLHQEERWKRLEEDLGEGRFHLILYTLDHFELTTHGGTVGGGWLTDKGTAVMEALEREQGDFVAFCDEHVCVHGFAITDVTHDCMEWDRRHA
jgi:hypothetical protein